MIFRFNNEKMILKFPLESHRNDQLFIKSINNNNKFDQNIISY